MTDFNLKNPTDINKNKSFTKKDNIHLVSERNELASKKLDSDKILQIYSEYANTFKPPIQPLEPSTFSNYGKASQYYEDSIYSIINYYPFDGTMEENIAWFISSSHLETSLFQQEWPTSVGHLNFDHSQYLSFYSGPQAIQESEFIGQARNNESGLKLDPDKGNTIEFWLRKEAFDASKQDREILFEIGSYPNKLPSSASSTLQVYLTTSAGNCFRMNYNSGSTSVSDLAIGPSTMSSSVVADSKWHHYVLSIFQNDKILNVKMYKDGQALNTVTNTLSTAMGPIDSYMAGTIGSSLLAQSGSLSGSVDSFRFWKGLRNSREIERYYDKKVHASDHTEKNYTNRLGASFRFNQPTIGSSTVDSLVLDHSGNDITARIKNYTTSTRVATSAIDLSDSANTEIKDPILKEAHSSVESLRQRLAKIAKSYDLENLNSLERILPSWARSSLYGFEDTKELDLLLHLMATVFDSVKINLDALRLNTRPEYADSRNPLYETSQSSNISSSLEKPADLDYDIVNNQFSQNKIDFMARVIENYGIELNNYYPLWHSEIEEVVESIVGNIRLERSIYETQNLIYDCLANASAYVLRRKGTESSFRSILNAAGLGKDLISTNIIGKYSNIYLNDSKFDLVTRKKKSISFIDNEEANIHLTSLNSNQRSYIAADTNETEYTFEGNFIFPKKKKTFHNVQDSSVFGVQSVSAINNNLTFASPNNASFEIVVSKESLLSNTAKFKLMSSNVELAGMTSSYYNDIYDSSVWNLALKITKDVDNSFIPVSSPSYLVEFVGKNYISDELRNSFHLSKSLTNTEYTNFKNANKTVFIGANRTNITGSVIIKSDIKVLDFNGWGTSLSDEELSHRAKTLTTFGTNRPFLFENLNNAENIPISDRLYLKMQTDNLTSIPEDNSLIIQDEIFGDQEKRDFFSHLDPKAGFSYPFTTFNFTNNLDNSISLEFLSAVENIPIGNIHGTDGIEIKENDSNKYDLDTKSELKIISFEKSMYNIISKDMVQFLSGIKSFNNLIGDPVNKYRKNYKLLSNLRSKYFFNLKNENQFERYVNYYKWIDKTVGVFLNQVVPAGVHSNTGIENVVESHILERNKIDYKLASIKHYEPEAIEASLINGRKFTETAEGGWTTLIIPADAEEDPRQGPEGQTLLQVFETSKSQNFDGKNHFPD